MDAKLETGTVQFIADSLVYYKELRVCKVKVMRSRGNWLIYYSVAGALLQMQQDCLGLRCSNDLVLYRYRMQRCYSQLQ